MKKIFIILTALFTITLAGAVSAGGADGLTDSAEATDSVALTPDSLLRRASDSFKKINFMKFDGEDDAAIFPQVMDAYKLTVEAIGAQEPRSRGWNQCKEMLREIDRDLYRGAFYYSSKNDSEQLTRYAQAYLDVQLMDQFKDEVWKVDQQMQAVLAYIAASGAYNAKDFDRAIDYFKLYFSTGDTSKRELVYTFMGQACLNAGKYDLGISTLRTGIPFYPDNKQLPLIGMQLCIDGGRAENLQEFLTAALAADPDSEQLLSVQGKLWEDEGHFTQALDLYNRLEEKNPGKLSTAKRIGLCYYNIAVQHFNDAVMAKDEKVAKKNRRQAKSYFAAAAQKLEEVVASDPMSEKYLKALGVSYLCLEQKEDYMRINDRLTALGVDPVAEVFMPSLVSASDTGNRNFEYNSGDLAKADVPLFSEYGSEYVGENLKKWSQIGEFEPLDAYKKRVNEASIKNEYERLLSEAGSNYLQEYGNRLRLTDIKLMPYDATNETFLIETSYGPIYLHVPLKDHEAEQFKSNFASVTFRNPTYFIDDNRVKIASIAFTLNGKTYNYDNQRAREYTGTPDIAIDFASILASQQPVAQNNQSGQSGAGYRVQKKSDVDENIPVAKKENRNTLALVIANEDYNNAVNVPSAINDGTVFAEYCRKTLGLPAENVNLVLNASLGNVYSALTDLKRKVDVLGGEADVIVYYAGHGMPDESTMDAFLMPVDADPRLTKTCYSMNELYKELGALDAKSVMVFLDACFSGAERSGNMIADARAVAVKPKKAAPKGNMFVFSATSDKETALPFAEKNHGMFTYFVLQKLQKSKGDVTLKDLADFVTGEVKNRSTFVNKKPQSPTVVTSGTMTDLWKTKKMK
ncbi:MAG: caspase family protein [Duncaniella sp.]|nr:caspase family protein [Duncaniella sp.]